MAFRRRAVIIIGALLLLHCVATASAQAQAVAKPKVRAITAFVQIDREHYQQQVAEALTVLRKTKAEIEKAGYEVESIRITTQPFPEYIGDLPREQALAFFRDYDALSAKEQFDPNIGPAMLHDADDPWYPALLAEVLSQTKNLESSIVVASDDGIHWRAITETAKLVKYVEAHSAHSQGNFNFTATAMLAPYGPFFPGSYHTGAGHAFSIGMESANVVDTVFSQHPGDVPAATEALIRALTPHATAMEKIGRQIEQETGWSYRGFDATPAPLKNVSIGAAIEKFTRAPLGSSGTMTAVSVITNAVRAVPVLKVGYNGLMLPVLEDSNIAQRWSEGHVHVDTLLAYSAVCGTGLDTIPMPGDVSQEQIEKMIGDMASLAFKWHKPLSARLQPVQGKKAGEQTDFDSPFLVNATIQPLP
jgi:uncharacterized protein (UPF0210 family)